jgi:Flp pilus assembly protein TadD/predicted aspartyl protease
MLPRFFLLFLVSASLCAQTAAGPASTTSATKPAAEATANADALTAAQALLKSHKYTEAAKAFRAIVDKQPTSVEGQLGLVRSLLRNQKVDDALVAATNAATVLPNSAQIHAWYGEVEFRAGQFGEAEREYRAALRLDRNYGRGWFGLARIYRMLSMPKSARGAFAKAHELAPDDDEITYDWLRSLPYNDELEALRKRKSSDQDDVKDDSERMKVLAAVAQKKIWTLVGEPRRVDIPLPLIGRKEMWSSDAKYNTNGTFMAANGYGVTVKFNGRTGAQLLLDTGASGILISRPLAEKAGVVKIADTFTFGIGDKGAGQAYVGWVDRINIGPLEFHDCIVRVSNRSNVAEDAGLIGADVFDKFLVTLDFKDHKLSLAPLPPNPNLADPDGAQDRFIVPEMQSFTRFYKFSDHIVVPVVVSDKTVANFMLDTGAEINVISFSLAQKVTKAGSEGYYQMRGISGSVDKVLTGNKVILQVAKMRIESHELPVFSMDSISSSFDTEISGLIGIRTLTQMKVTIDYRDGLISLTPYEFRKATE